MCVCNKKLTWSSVNYNRKMDQRPVKGKAQDHNETRVSKRVKSSTIQIQASRYNCYRQCRVNALQFKVSRQGTTAVQTAKCRVKALQFKYSHQGTTVMQGVG